MNLRTEKVNCDLCGSEDYTWLLDGKERRQNLPGIFSVVECRRCHLVYLNPRPDSESLPGYYPDDYAPYSRGKRLKHRLQTILRRREARQIRKWLSSKARLLEIGCATGDLLVPLRDEGLDVAGIEISPYASSVARQNFGLKVHTGTVFDAQFEKESFDAVVMRQVIEHLPSPKAALQKTISFLKPGGFIFIRTENFDGLEQNIFRTFWHGLDLPRHFYFFTPNTLSSCLGSVGFEVRQIRYNLVTNYWIMSLKSYLEERYGKKPYLNLLALWNPVIVLSFFPIVLLQKFCKRTSRMHVIAMKTNLDVL